MTNLTIGTTAFVYSGAAEERTVLGGGTITVDLWGGAGGGGYFTGAGGPGGAGGYTRVVFTVQAGDVVKIETGQGGRKSPGPVSNGGVGGWPDGGSGGAYAPLANTLGTSGGGGSSRLYINGVLVAVAGAGGGGLAGGGAGGGTNGLDAPPQAGVDNTASGGTQTQGGYRQSFTNYALTPPLIRGSSLQGGHGWGNASGTANTNNSTPSEFTGCGGGGGYFGGAGGRANERQFPSGGGGSSYLATALGSYVSGSTTAGSGATPSNGAAADRPAGIAVGGVTGAGTQTDGGDGYVRVLYESTESPGEAAGDLATITVTSPAGTANGATSTSGDLATFTLTPPAATAAGSAQASAEIGTVTTTPPLADPVSSALVIIGINDDVELYVTPPEGEAVGEFTPLELPMPGPILLGAPQASAGVPIAVSGEIGTLTITPPEAVATEAIDAIGEAFPAVVFTAPEADATGAAVAIATTTGEGDNRVLGTLLLGDSRAPQAFVETIGSATGALPAAIILTAPEGTAQEGAVGNTEPFENDITITAPDATATGSVNVIPPTEGGIESPYGTYLKLVLTTPPAATATAGVLVSGALPQITMSSPLPIVQMGATVLVSMPRRIEMRAPQGTIIFEGEAVAGGDLGTIEITPPEAEVLVDDASADVVAEGDLPVVTLTPPAATLTIAAAAAGQPATVTMQSPEAFVLVIDEATDVVTSARLRFKRTFAPGRAPFTLADREIVLNETDGVLFSRNSDGEVVETAYAALVEGRFAPDGGAPGQILTDSGVWEDPNPVFDAPIRVPDASGGRIALLEAALGTSEASVDADVLFYRPFFIPQALEIADLGVEVVDTAAGVAWLGVCAWSMAGAPGDTLLSGSVSTTVSGLRTIAGSVTLQPGWYAAMFAYAGAGAPTFRAASAPVAMNSDFEPVGDPTAPFEGSLDPAPAVEGFQTAARGYLTAEVA